jgi:integrase
MARMLKKLPKTYLSLKPGLHSDGGNLYLQISIGKEGNRRLSWIFRYRMRGGGKLRDVGLGSANTVSLVKAREFAAKYRLALLEGKNPKEERDAAKANAGQKPAVMTFDACATAYITAHEVGWRNAKHRQQWNNSLRDYASPSLGALPVDEITTEHVLECLKPAWFTRPETASRVRQRIERILDWARVRGFRQGENPARWRGHLDHLLPAKNKVAKVRHFAAMLYRDVPALMSRLRKQTDITSKAFAFLILTAARSGEVVGARWAEIDFEAKAWGIPAERMKADRSHRVALSAGAMEILEEMRAIRCIDFIFPSFEARSSRGHLSAFSLSMAPRRMGIRGATVHGMRSSFRDWCGEETSFPREICEGALAHGLGDKTEAAYRRGDALEKRRRLMEAWANYIGPPADTKVLPLRKGAPA